MWCTICIADLFLRTDEGASPKIQAHFQKYHLEIDESPMNEFLANCVRMVFVKVQNNLVRLLGEVDPALGKILRNVHLAIEKSDTLAN